MSWWCMTTFVSTGNQRIHIRRNTYWSRSCSQSCLGSTWCSIQTRLRLRHFFSEAVTRCKCKKVTLKCRSVSNPDGFSHINAFENITGFANQWKQSADCFYCSCKKQHLWDHFVKDLNLPVQVVWSSGFLHHFGHRYKVLIF